MECRMRNGLILTILRRAISLVLPFLLYVVDFLSFEWLLTNFNYPNGGGIIFIRALCISLLTLVAALLLKFGFDFSLLFNHFFAYPEWLGAIFAVVYAALYSRFASQWSYLANLYNQIKAVEVKEEKFDKNSAQWKRLCEWKAGYIEDADTLHLSTKPSVAPIIYHWIRDDGVKAAFKTTPGQEDRLKRIRDEVEKVFIHENERQKNLASRGP